MNLCIYRFWFHDEADHVDEWSFPVRNSAGPAVQLSATHCQGPAKGCWALFRILGGYYP